MKEHVIKRLKEEFLHYQEKLVSGNFTAVQLVEDAYQIAIKEHIVECIQLLSGESRFTKNIWDLLNEQKFILDYLYKLWIHCDVTFSQELADTLMDEVYYDKEAYNYE